MESILPAVWHTSGNWDAKNPKDRIQSGGNLYIREISTETPMLDLNKPIQFRDGTPLTIIARGVCQDGQTDKFVVMGRKNGEDFVLTYGRNGINGDNKWDVINVPPEKKKITLFIDIYQNGSFVVRKQKETEEIKFSNSPKIAHLEKEIEYTEGEGLTPEED